jgi:hypothetical protein
MSQFGALAVAVADGKSGNAPGREDNADRDAVLERPRRVGPASAGARVFHIRGGQLRQITNDHTIGNRVAASMLADACPAPGRPIRPPSRHGPAGPADRRPVPAVCRRTRPVVDDGTHFYVLTLRAISADALASWPAPAADRASASRLTPYHWARVLQAGQAGSRLPLRAEDARPQISRDTGRCETPGGASGAAFVPDAPERIGVPSP